VFHWRWTHPVISAIPDDPWGITTPPWIVEALFPVLMFGSLAQACQQALCGNRQWKFVGTATLVMAVAGLSETLQAFTAAK
jgi:cobalamin biosynthesis protein CobD/CbiB